MPSSEDPHEPDPIDDSTHSPQAGKGPGEDSSKGKKKSASKSGPPDRATSKPGSSRPRTRLEKKESEAYKDIDDFFDEMLRPPSPAEDFAKHRPYENRGPTAILKSLLDGDPLEVWDRCEEYLEEEHYVIDVERLALRATARTAYALHSYDDREDFELFMVAIIRKSARELLDEDLYGRPRHAAKDRTPNPLLIFTKNDEKKADAFRNRLNAAPKLQRAALILVDLDVIPIPKAAKALSVSEDVLFEALLKARELIR